MHFRRGIATGLLLVWLVTIAYLLLGASREARPKFHLGQVVAVIYATPVPQYFRVGYIDRETYGDGAPYFLYTDATEKIDGEWPEVSLRAITQTECK